MTSTTGSSRSPDEWRELIRQHASSGQSIKAFCERHGVAPSAYFYWRRRLVTEPSTALAVSFVAVEAAPVAQTPLELVLRGGRCVRVAAGFDPATLLRLIDVVEGGA